MVPATSSCPDTTATPATLAVGVGVGVEDMLGVPEPPHATHIAKMGPSSAAIAILTKGFIGVSALMAIVPVVLREQHSA